MNAYWEELKFELPELPKGLKWHRIIDTSLDHPEDFRDPGASPLITTKNYRTHARSTVVLMGLL
jgi:glycogen operon protein